MRKNDSEKNDEIFIPIWWKNIFFVFMLIIPVCFFLISVMNGIYRGIFLQWITNKNYCKTWAGELFLGWFLAFMIYFSMNAGHIIIKDGIITKRYCFVYTKKMIINEILDVSMGRELIKNEGGMHLDINSKSNKIIYVNTSLYSKEAIKLICNKIGFSL